MRMIFFAALSLAFSRNSFLFSQQPAEFTEQEIKIIQSCEENITNKVYSPVEADKCLSYLHAENDKLLDKLYDKKPDGTRRAELILKYENALKELGDFYEDNPREDLIQKKLIKLLEFDYEAEGCSLCDIGMGPQPEKIGEWAGKHAPAHSNKTLSAIKTWKALPNVRTQSLGKYGYTEANWADKTIRQRAATLVADEILQEELTKDNRKELRRAADDILFLLDAGMQERLEEYFKDSKEPAAKADKTAAKDPAAPPKSLKNLEKFGELKKLSSDSQLAQLYDGSIARPDSLPDHGKPGISFLGGTKPKDGGTPEPKYILSDYELEKVADKLKKNYTSPRGELSGTKVGDELIAYYNDTKDTDPELKKLKQLNLSVNKLQDGMDAAYYPGTNEIVINKKKVEQWMRDNNMSADKLLDEKNEENFNGLTRYLAPIFVHEATHQTQAYWAKSNKIPDNYYLNQETESFAKEALFLKEKMENPATSKFYTAGSVSSSEIYLKNVLERDGLKGLRSYIRDYNIHNLEGEASKKFTRLEAALKEQNLRKNGVERDTLMPALCDKVKLSSCSDEQIQEMINTTYPWYKKAVQKEKKDAEFIQSELYRLDNLKKNYKYTIKSGEVPLMEEYGD